MNARHVAALLDGVPHAAALLGEGSKVLGFDTERSTDHAWGPRLQVFVREELVEEARRRVEDGLPDEVRGWPTRFYRWQVDGGAVVGLFDEDRLFAGYSIGLAVGFVVYFVLSLLVSGKSEVGGFMGD